jgi:hypothetical protein
MAVSGEGQRPPDPAAERGWIVVVRGPGGGQSGAFTEELPGKYAARPVTLPTGLGLLVFDNLKLTISGAGQDPWSVVAPRNYQGTGFLMTHLFYLDTPGPEVTDQHALDLMLGYKSFVFGVQTYVLFCPPRAKVTWEGDWSGVPVINGEAKANATLTISLDKRTPIVVKGKLLKVERGMGRIQVDQVDGGAAK